MIKVKKAIQIFIDYMENENRLPEKKEFDYEFYGKEMPYGTTTYYYKVKKIYLQEMKDNG